MSQPFDYESAIWGADTLLPGERSIAGYRLEEAMRWLPQGGKLLEVGCGAGRYLRALGRVRPDLERVGCDVSRAALAQVGPGVETRLAEVGAPLPADDAEFQAVWVLDVLEHVERPDALLAEARRVLTPGGVLHLHVPCEGDALSLWRWLPGQGGESGLKRRFGGHVQRFRRRDLLARLEAAGFRILRVRYSLHLLGALADVAAFLSLALRARRGEAPGTTADLMAGGGAGAPLVRAVDALLWCEARLLTRVPSWGIHVSARKAV